jgi:alpha-galactosidase
VYGREWLNETHVLAQSAALAASPLAAAGFAYVLVDSFWAADPTRVVDAWGRWTPNATRFPSGMRALADAVHARGQRLGLYINPGVPPAAVHAATPVLGGAGNCTAADIVVQPVTGANQFWDGYKMNYSHPCTPAWIASVAALFATEWGVDALKIDAVSPGSDASPPLQYDSRLDVNLMSAALAATGRPVWVALSWALDAAFAGDFVPAANSVRTSDDVVCYCDTLVEWPSVARLFTQARPWLPVAGAGWAATRLDLDSLDVANGALDGLTDDEKTAAATLWVIVAGTLYTGNDLTALTPDGVARLTNARALAIHAAGVAAAPTPSSPPGAATPVWAAGYGNGTFTVALFNLGDTPAPVTAVFAEFVGAAWAGAAFDVSDVWAGGAPVGVAVRGNFTSLPLPPHGAQLLTLAAVGAGG